MGCTPVQVTCQLSEAAIVLITAPEGVCCQLRCRRLEAVRTCGLLVTPAGPYPAAEKWGGGEATMAFSTCSTRPSCACRELQRDRYLAVSLSLYLLAAALCSETVWLSMKRDGLRRSVRFLTQL